MLIGWAVYAVLGAVRRRITDPVADTAVSFVAPFAAYLPAELVGSSGVLAVVTTGLLLGHRSLDLQSARSRLAERTNWASVQFLLENAVFLLIGLQVAGTVRDVQASGVSLARSLALGLVVLVAVLTLRPVWVFPFRWVSGRVSPSRRSGWRETAVASWAGMRGVVTLAAALVLPTETPYRATIVLVAVVVTVGTLLIQGTTLPVLARLLDVHGPDPRVDALQEATVLRATAAAGLRELEADPSVDPDTEQRIRDQRTRQIDIVWERLGGPDPERETPSETYRRARLSMLQTERAELVAIRRDGTVDREVLARVLDTMDVEESVLLASEERGSAVRDSPIRAPDPLAAHCPHLAEAAEVCVVPGTPEGCAECLRDGTPWVHLRICLACGHVGCCDSSVGRHADGHFRDSGHAVMRSLQPGEAWRWCYVDEVLG